jgi:hypothetical protein
MALAGVGAVGRLARERWTGGGAYRRLVLPPLSDVSCLSTDGEGRAGSSRQTRLAGTSTECFYRSRWAKPRDFNTRDSKGNSCYLLSADKDVTLLLPQKAHSLKATQLPGTSDVTGRCRAV